ncbi:hypothetical protein DVR09_01270 [Erythrobacter aureus]|uniref:Uncharacterized protein n=1 Tax=Erythrobacter aureus TaxID=2182384 RepID=A0A345YB34_9SPHN|nr:hypothetical protein DVR09_01270 [Erythrobacter aureus]
MIRRDKMEKGPPCASPLHLCDELRNTLEAKSVGRIFDMQHGNSGIVRFPLLRAMSVNPGAPLLDIEGGAPSVPQPGPSTKHGPTFPILRRQGVSHAK